MSALHKSVRTPTLLSAQLRKLERQGRFAEALANCLEIIDGVAVLPALEFAEPRERAELMLRYGALIGFLGHNSQIANSQEQSKDLLTRALAEFIELNDQEKIAECENYIALAYWRLGELNEAFVWLQSSFERPIPRSSEPRVAWYGCITLLYIDRKQFQKVIDLLVPVKQDFLDLDDPYLLGIYHTNLGIAYKDVGRLRDAIEAFELSRHYNQLAKHQIYLGTVENNIALLYSELGEFEKANAAIGNAINIFKRTKDKTREGFAQDTRANILLRERKLSSALRAIDKSIDILKRGENAGYRVESLVTRSKILLNLDRFSDAVLSLFEAVEISRVTVGEDSARELIAEFEAESKRVGKDAAMPTATADGLQLLLPPSISNHDAYSAVRIGSDHLERFGLTQGSLAIIVESELKRGDLAAVELITDGSIKCGVFDRDFGLVCLDRGDSEPELFDENDIRILGKIIGVGRGLPEVNGEVVVQPLTT